MRKYLAPAIFGLMLSACGHAPEAASLQAQADEEVTPEEVQQIRGFKATLDKSTIDAWTASVGKVNFMPYDQVSIDSVTDDGKSLTLTLTNMGVHVRTAKLDLGTASQANGSRILPYAYDELNVYNHFQLNVSLVMGKTSSTPKVELAEISSIREFTMTPLYNAKAVATFRPAQR